MVNLLQSIMNWCVKGVFMSKKKRIFVYCFGMLLFICAIIVVYQLFFKVEPIKLAKQNASEKGMCYFLDKTNDLATLSVYSGERENPYNLDGVHNATKAFTLILLRTNLLDVMQPTFSIKIDGVNYDGQLEYNPIDNTYYYDLGISVLNNSLIMGTVMVKDMEFSFTPTNQNTTWGIDFDEAFDIGLNSMKGVIENLVSNGKFDGETYVKVVTDNSGILDTYYYYVGIIDVDGNMYSVVLDTVDGKILSK